MRNLNELSTELEELEQEEAELQASLKEIKEEMRKRFPRGFDGNGVPGEFESWEHDYNDVLRELEYVRDEKRRVSDELVKATFNGVPSPD